MYSGSSADGLASKRAQPRSSAENEKILTRKRSKHVFDVGPALYTQDLHA